MTKLDAIKKRLAESTPGPWAEEGSDEVVDYCLIRSASGKAVIDAIWSEHLYDISHSDLDFICASPTDIALLLEVAEAAKLAMAASKQIAGLQAWIDETSAYDQLALALSKLEAEDDL